MPTGFGESDKVVLELGGIALEKWQTYNFNNDFLTPTDGWTFQVAGDQIEREMLPLLKPGSLVQLKVNDNVQCTGYLDVFECFSDRSGGTVITLEGRDAMAPVCDTMIDTHRIVGPGKSVTLANFLADHLKNYGFTSFGVTQVLNDQVQTGQTVRRTKHRNRKPLGAYAIQKVKPLQNEALFSYLSRVTQRYGLWLWASADGTGVIAGQPDYDQAATFTLIHRRGGAQNNVLSGGIRRDSTDQPSAIIVRGNVPGNTFEKVTTSAYVPNQFNAYDSAKFYTRALSVGDIKTSTVVVPMPPIAFQNAFASLVARPLYMKDDKSTDLEQLQKFALREMSLRTRKAIVGRYTVNGHTQNGIPWIVDSVVDVDDDISGWHAPMWIKSRTFRKSRSGGTTTELEMLPLGAIVFGLET